MNAFADTASFSLIVSCDDTPNLHDGSPVFKLRSSDARCACQGLCQSVSIANNVLSGSIRAACRSSGMVASVQCPASFQIPSESVLAPSTASRLNPLQVPRVCALHHSPMRVGRPGVSSDQVSPHSYHIFSDQSCLPTDHQLLCQCA